MSILGHFQAILEFASILRFAQNILIYSGQTRDGRKIELAEHHIKSETFPFNSVRITEAKASEWRSNIDAKVKRELDQFCSASIQALGYQF